MSDNDTTKFDPIVDLPAENRVTPEQAEQLCQAFGFNPKYVSRILVTPNLIEVDHIDEGGRSVTTRWTVGRHKPRGAGEPFPGMGEKAGHW